MGVRPRPGAPSAKPDAIVSGDYGRRGASVASSRGMAHAAPIPPREEYGFHHRARAAERSRALVGSDSGEDGEPRDVDRVELRVATLDILRAIGEIRHPGRLEARTQGRDRDATSLVS